MYNCVENTDFRGKSCSVCGIGISNYPLIDFLLSRGASVVARDRKSEAELSCAAALRSRGVELRCGEDYLDDIEEDYIFRAPGIRYDVPGFVRAVERGSILTSEMQLFFELCPCRIIGITGSDGKNHHNNSYIKNSRGCGIPCLCRRKYRKTAASRARKYDRKRLCGRGAVELSAAYNELFRRISR